MSNPSQASLLELKAITAEHVDKFSKEGRGAVKGQQRQRQKLSEKSKDPFDRPSPGLVKRLAAEARNDAKRRFQDESGPSEEQRRAILKAKAKKYEALSRGDYSGLSEKDLAEVVIDFERKAEEDGYSDHSSDVDESARAPRRTWSDDDDDDDDNGEDDLEQIEYVDEIGRTRVGTKREAREADAAKRQQAGPLSVPTQDDSAYAEVLKSHVIHGEQSFFPVYEPDPEAIKAKYRTAEEEARAHHYDASKEVRVKGAGQYQFSLDEAQRAEQRASLDAERLQTEKARANIVSSGMTAAQEARKRKVDERKALVDAKRAKLLGGKEKVDKLREEKRAAEADRFLKSLESELDR